MSETILLKNGAEIPDAERLFPLVVERNGESVRVLSSYHLKPGDLLEVRSGLAGSFNNNEDDEDDEVECPHCDKTFVPKVIQCSECKKTFNKDDA